MVKDYIKVKDKVQHCLEKYPDLRDDDNRLIAHIWYNGLSEQQKNTSVYEFLMLFSRRQVDSPEAIRRARQKLQEEVPELRGEKYAIRHKESELMKEELNK